MPYNSGGPERGLSPQEIKQEKEKEGVEKVQEFITETMVPILKQEGVPLDKQARIDMGKFENVYYSSATIVRDKRLLENYIEQWSAGMSGGEGGGTRIRKRGERLEMLKSAIFFKNLRKEFIVVRSSLFDDVVNNVDNVIIERKTGNVVCALDEVAEIKGFRYEEKRKEVLDKNFSKGVELKYGLLLKKEEGEMKLKLSEISHLPIFYLALHESAIEKALDNFQNSLTEQSDYEKKIFEYFIASLNSQIQSLLLSPNLHSDIEKRVQRFREILENEIKSKN